MYAYRRALWNRSLPVDCVDGIASVPLSVSRVLAAPFTGTDNIAVVKDFSSVKDSTTIGVICSGEIVESSVVVSPDLIDFGECNVGDYKSASILLTNNSHKFALVVPYFESETISLSRKQVYLEPGQSFRIVIDYVVRVVDPKYSKVITFVNVLNPVSELNVKISAKNVDTFQMLQHDMFYKLYTYSGSKQIILYSKQCMFCQPNLRIFSLRNVYSAELKVKLTADNTKDVSIFVVNNASIECDGEILKAVRWQEEQGGVAERHSDFLLLTKTDAANSEENISAAYSSCFTEIYRCSSDISKAITRSINLQSPLPAGGTGLKQKKEKSQHRDSSSYALSTTDEVDVDVGHRVVSHYKNCYDMFHMVNYFYSLVWLKLSFF